MTIQEMHIEFDVVLDEIMSKTVQSVLPEQRDWLINQAIGIFISNRINPKSNAKQDGFLDTQKRYDDLEAIIVPNFNITSYQRDGFRAVFQLPWDYLHLVSDCSRVYHKCGADMSSEVTAATSTTAEHITKVPLDDDPNNWEDLSITYTPFGGSPTEIWNASEYWFDADGFGDNSEKFYLIDIILQEINALVGYTVYWEYYRGQYYNNCFIFVNDGQGTYTVITDDGVTPDNNAYASTQSTLNDIRTDNFSDDVRNAYNNNRLTKRQDLKAVLDFSYSKTKYQSPVSSLAQRQLIVDFDTTFEVTEVEIDYIRKPQLVNLQQGINCELAPATHKEIVDIAARRYKALKTGGYQQHATESVIIE